MFWRGLRAEPWGEASKHGVQRSWDKRRTQMFKKISAGSTKQRGLTGAFWKGGNINRDTHFKQSLTKFSLVAMEMILSKMELVILFTLCYMQQICVCVFVLQIGSLPERARFWEALFWWRGPTLQEATLSPGPETHQCLPPGRSCLWPCTQHHGKSVERMRGGVKYKSKDLFVA